jgi:NAD(P)-dependent dehydrogenase (short-subunit alcohol dehydrogenase family)
MYNEVVDCNVFINNADLGWNQSALLYELWEKWKDTDKLIVSIGSDSADYNQSAARPYNIQKRALQDACLQLQQAKQLCKVVLVKPGYVDTPRVQHITATKMDPKELALYIKKIVELRNSTFWIPVVTLYPR